MEEEMSDERLIITADEAISLLPSGKYVHNFAQGGMALIGCDYSRADAEKALRGASEIEIAGDMARGMKHPIACWESDNRVTFFAADMDKLDAFEASRLAA